MKKKFISSDSIKTAINYFKNTNFSKDDFLTLFLLAKHFGISETNAIKINPTNDPNIKKEHKEALINLGSIAEDNELVDDDSKNSILFPFSFQTIDTPKINFYQPATPLKNKLSRAKDTIEKKNINTKLYNNNESYLTLVSNYKEIVSNFLNGNKISLSYLASWLYRFTEFEFQSNPSNIEFTKVIKKLIFKFFNITKSDLQWLFDDDLLTHIINSSDSMISGEKLRDNLLKINSETIDFGNKNIKNTHSPSVIKEKITTKLLSTNGDNPTVSDILELLLSKKQIILTGVPGIGKSLISTELANIKNESNENIFYKTNIIQFHQNYTYEDFIGGNILINNPETNKMEIKQKKGKFLEAIEEAKNDPDHKHKFLFVIDEINRGNIAAIFGETILTLDREYTVQLSNSIDDWEQLSIPENLYILGTMNTSDRNIAFLDLALRRRFAFVNLLPNYEFLSEKITLKVSTQIKTYNFNLGAILKDINQKILNILNDPSKILGQSYFIPDSKKYNWKFEDFKNQFNYVILPALSELQYQKNNLVSSVVGEELASTILDKEQFKTAFIQQYSEMIL